VAGGGVKVVLAERGLQGGGERIPVQILKDGFKIREFCFEIGQGFFPIHQPDPAEKAGVFHLFLNGRDGFIRAVFTQKKNNDLIIGDIPGEELDVVGKRQENSQCEKSETDDHNGKNVPDSVLPDAAGRGPGEIFQIF
jgi:hypothetical protein